VSHPRQHPDAGELLEAVIEGIAQRVTERVAEKLLGLQPKQPAPEPPYYDARELAARLRIRPRTLETWRRRGTGPQCRKWARVTCTRATP
jgi:hypothetical protein